MMETTTKEHTIRRTEGAAQVQTTGGAAGVDARCGVRSGESVRRAAAMEELRGLFSRINAQRQERRELAEQASEALKRLVGACAQKTGQGYHLRDLLYSLWNGQPASLLEMVSLDWELRKDLLTVLGAFGYEGEGLSFFYDEVRAAFEERGLFDWFQDAWKGVAA